MNIADLPFNLDLLLLTAADLKGMSEIKVLDITDGMSKNFNSEGLFSTEIFGKIGEERRNRLFGYINMYVPIFHPTIYKAIEDLKGLYAEILAGKSYAIFDSKLKDFVKSNVVDGETGFAFFMKHFEELKFEVRPSPKREFNIKLIDIYHSNCTMDKLLVLPAGLRDYTIDENGKPSEDEINTMYRRVMSIASIVQNVNAKNNLEYLDAPRFSMQQRVNEIYFYLVNLMEGKSKLFQGKWASRKIFDSTRNVITPYIPRVEEFFTEKTVSVNQTSVGLYQYLRNIMPLAVNQVRDTYLSRVFIGPNTPAVLVNKKTLKKELVHIDPDHYDEWMTYEGLEKVMASFGQEELRDDILEIDNYYFGLLYQDSEKVRFIQDIDDLPEHYDRKYVRPITFCELLYLSVYKDAPTIPALVTRYPITGYGSVYPSYIYLKTTTHALSLDVLDPDTGIIASRCLEFPITGEQYFNAMSPSPSHLLRLGADHDRVM